MKFIQMVLPVLKMQKRMPASAQAGMSNSVESTLAAANHDALQTLAENLVKRGLLTTASLDRVQKLQARTGERLDHILLSLGLVAERQLLSEIASILNVPVIEPGDIPSHAVLPELAGAGFARNRRLIPLCVDERGIFLGMADPFDDEPVRALAYLTELPVHWGLISAGLFEKAVNTLYGELETTPREDENADRHPAEANDEDIERLRDQANDAPVVRLVGDIIAGAVEARASDIHFEPTPDGVDVRFRVDGHLYRERVLKPEYQAAVTSRIKIMARLDIAERRLPQDGRIRLPIGGIGIDLRISTIATAFGESVVLRILDKSSIALDFASLGFYETQIVDLAAWTSQPNGIILVTGPTGSGKTTTLYTMLSSINRPGAKIFTVEDPVEYQLAGINQVQVHPAIGLDFPHALRSILRQDPDLIMIGEIRDIETARIAIQAALTGHMVFSTLHTNSAAGAVTRLMDMGLEPYLLSSTITGVIAQRLVRRLCKQCAVTHVDAEFWEARIRPEISAEISAQKPAILQAQGCQSCRDTGFSGRLVIAEFMPLVDRSRTLILERASEADLHNHACGSGMRTLYQEGLRLVWSGRATIKDVLGLIRTAV
jgi:general secretion pathway protein E